MMSFGLGRILFDRVGSVGAAPGGGGRVAGTPEDVDPAIDLSTAAPATPAPTSATTATSASSSAPRAASRNLSPVVNNPLARGLTVAPRSTPTPARPTFVTSTVPESSWDDTTRAAVRSVDRSIRNGSTPAFQVNLREGDERTTRSPRYADHEDIAGQYEVSNLGSDRKLKLRMVLPVSGHTGDQDGNGVADYEEYARSDKAVVWVAYVDQNGKRPGDTLDIPWDVQSMPDPDQPSTWPRGVQVLARDIACPPGELSRVVDVDIPMIPGKVAVVMFDGNGDGPGAGPGGFVCGRLKEYFWNAPAGSGMASATAASTALPLPGSGSPRASGTTPTPRIPTTPRSTGSVGSGSSGTSGSSGSVPTPGSPGSPSGGTPSTPSNPGSGSVPTPGSSGTSSTSPSGSSSGANVPRPGGSVPRPSGSRIDFAAAPGLPDRPDGWGRARDIALEVVSLTFAHTDSFDAVDPAAWKAFGKAQAQALETRVRRSYIAKSDQELIGQLAAAIHNAQPRSSTEAAREAAQAMVAGMREAPDR